MDEVQVRIVAAAQRDGLRLEGPRSSLEKMNPARLPIEVPTAHGAKALRFGEMPLACSKSVLGRSSIRDVERGAYRASPLPSSALPGLVRLHMGHHPADRTVAAHDPVLDGDIRGVTRALPPISDDPSIIGNEALQESVEGDRFVQGETEYPPHLRRPENLIGRVIVVEYADLGDFQGVIEAFLAAPQLARHPLALCEQNCQE